MPNGISTNMASLVAQNNLTRSHSLLEGSFARLSSGLRIQSAKDDAAGMAISQGMTMQVRSYVVAERNANDATSMAQTAEGAVGEITSVLGRMRELAMQGANGFLSTADRSYMQTEFSQLQAEVTRIMTATVFDNVHVCSKTQAAMAFQVGINNTVDDRLTITFGGLQLTALLSASNRVASAAGNSLAALGIIDTALDKISTVRSRYGAFMSRIDLTVASLQTQRTNITAARSSIQDVDIAEETANLSKNQVLVQAGTSVVAQANQIPQIALNLLK